MNGKVIGSVCAGSLLVYEILEDGEFSVKIREVEHPEKFVSMTNLPCLL